MCAEFDRLKLLNAKDRSLKLPLVSPRDAASLIVVDRRSGPYRILMGLRHHKSSFMPNVYVFPGGALDLVDIKLAKVQTQLKPFDQNVLFKNFANDAGNIQSIRIEDHFNTHSHHTQQRAAGIASASDKAIDGALVSHDVLGASLALCALRELLEETGLHLGQYTDRVDTNQNLATLNDELHPFSTDIVSADKLQLILESMTFLSRAITPPGIKQRFDTRFFLYDYKGDYEWVHDGDNELVETAWVSFEEALSLNLHPMTRVILEDTKDHLNKQDKLKQPRSVAFYHYNDETFHREWIEMETPS